MHSQAGQQRTVGADVRCCYYRRVLFSRRRFAGALALAFSIVACEQLAPDDLSLNRRAGPGGMRPDTGPDASARDTGPQGDASNVPGPGFALVVVEAEDYDLRDPHSSERDFYLEGKGQPAASLPTPDPDPSHADSASGAACLEVLPDTRVPGNSNEDGLFGTAGDGPLLNYYIAFPEAGTYYLWIRGYSTDTEDETVFFTVDTQWDKAVLVKLCSDVDAWQWASHERMDALSCGLIGQVRLEIPSAGLHTVSVAAREDGLELDKWLLTTDPNFVPRGYGPDATQ